MHELYFTPDSILEDIENKSKTMKFYSSDSKVEFVRNQRVIDPKYHQSDIEYSFNSHGYRTREFADVKDNEFILVFGCSHTEGVGLHEEDIWCSQLCNALGIDKINLGKAGSGHDVQYLNTVQYIKNKYPMPKMVIYQWPQITRRGFSFVKDNSIEISHYTVSGTSDDKLNSKWYLKRYCGEPGEREMLAYSNYTAANELWKAHGVPVYNWTWLGDFESMFVDLKEVETKDTGRARDMMHDGADIHSQVVEQIKPDIDKMLNWC